MKLMIPLIGFLFLLSCGGDKDNMSPGSENGPSVSRQLQQTAENTKSKEEKVAQQTQGINADEKGNNSCSLWLSVTNFNMAILGLETQERTLAASECLLARGIDVNTRGSGDLPLCDSLYQIQDKGEEQYLEVLKWLLDKGADTNKLCDSIKPEFFPIHLASAWSSNKALDLIIKHNAHLEKRAKSSDFTPLMIAVATGQLENVKLLVSKGADLLASYHGRQKSVLDLARAQQEDKEILRYLAPLVEREKDIRRRHHP